MCALGWHLFITINIMAYLNLKNKNVRKHFLTHLLYTFIKLS